MIEDKVEVIAYSGYRGEEIPKAIILHNERIAVLEILDSWVEEGVEDRVRKRFFKVKGDDGSLHEIYYDEKEMEWFYKGIIRWLFF
jgi:hypothetical protein